MSGGEDAGTWKRTVTPAAVRVTVRPDTQLSSTDVDEVEAAAHRLAGFLGKPLELDVAGVATVR